MPLFCIDWLPAVKPSSGVKPVSAVMIWISLGSTESSSAATMMSAVLMPCPSSALPVKTVILPSRLIRIQESSVGASESSFAGRGLLHLVARATDRLADASQKVAMTLSASGPRAITVSMSAKAAGEIRSGCTVIRIVAGIVWGIASEALSRTAGRR